MPGSAVVLTSTGEGEKDRIGAGIENKTVIEMWTRQGVQHAKDDIKI